MKAKPINTIRAKLINKCWIASKQSVPWHLNARSLQMSEVTMSQSLSVITVQFLIWDFDDGTLANKGLHANMLYEYRVNFIVREAR
jgi:hypothetical protein